METLFYSFFNSLGINQLKFEFNHVTANKVLCGLLKMKDDSSPCIVGAPTRLLKSCAEELKDPIAALFNHCQLYYTG